MEILTKEDIQLDFNKSDLNDMERVVKSDDFVQFLLNHTTSFSAAAMILNTLFNKIDELGECVND